MLPGVSARTYAEADPAQIFARIVVLAAARDMGAPVVTLCTGSRVDLLGRDIVLAHAKDIAADGWPP